MNKLHNIMKKPHQIMINNHIRKLWLSIVVQPCNWLLELFFRLCGCAGIRLWGLFILAVRMAICLSMWFRPYVHSSFCVYVTSVLPYSSPVLLVTRIIGIFFSSWALSFKLKLFKAKLKHLKTFLHVLICRAAMLQRKTFSADLTYKGL